MASHYRGCEDRVTRCCPALAQIWKRLRREDTSCMQTEGWITHSMADIWREDLKVPYCHLFDKIIVFTLDFSGVMQWIIKKTPLNSKTTVIHNLWKKSFTVEPFYWYLPFSLFDVWNLESAGSNSPGTTAGSTWDRQTACPQDSRGTPPVTLAYCDVSRTAAQPTAPAHKTGSDATAALETWRRPVEEALSHPIVLRQPLGDVFGASPHSARLISVFEQEMVLQGPNLQRGKQDTGQAAWSAGNDIIRRHLVPAACSNIVIAR